jgi:hypothetical protein
MSRGTITLGNLGPVAWRAGRFGEGECRVHPDDRHKAVEITTALADPANINYKAKYRVIGIEDGVERWIRTQGRWHMELKLRGSWIRVPIFRRSSVLCVPTAKSSGYFRGDGARTMLPPE